MLGAMAAHAFNGSTWEVYKVSSRLARVIKSEPACFFSETS